MSYLQAGLIVIFILAGTLLVISEPYPLPFEISLEVFLEIPSIVFGASFFSGNRKSKATIPPVVDDLEQIARAAYKKAKRLVILVVGVTVCLVGIFLIVLPGPAVVVIPAGLAILASEFAWARRLLRKAKKQIEDISPNG